MNIASITLRNFRSYENTAFDLEPLSIFRGLNGSGKSSLQMAIELALTGRCAVTDQAGRGADLLIRSGEQEFEVRADVFVGSSDPGTLVRVRQNASGQSHVIERGDTQLAGKDAEQWIAEHIAPKSVLSAVLDSSRFLKLSEAEQKNLLASVLLPVDTKFDEPILALLKEMSFGTGEGNSLFERIDKLYKKAYEERTVVNRELRDLKGQKQPSLPGELPSIEDIKKKLAEIQFALVEAQTTRSDLRVGYEKELSAYNLNFQRRNSMERSIATTKLQASQCEAKMLSPERIKELKKIAKGAAKAKALDAEAQNLQAAANLAWIALEAAQGMEGISKCPTCQQDVTEGVLAAIYGPLVGASDAAKGAVRKAMAEREKLGDPVLAQRQVEEHEEASKHLESFVQSIRQADADLAPLDVLLEGGEPIAPSTAEVDAAIHALTERISRGNEKLAEVAALHQQKKQWSGVEEKRSAAEAKLQKLEILISEFGSEGLKSRLLKQHLGKFTEAINRILDLFGYQARIVMEPYAIEVSWKDQDFLQLKQLSESQQYRFGVALQIALAAITEVRFVLVDRADILDAESIGLLYRALHEHELIDQAIMLGTSTYKDAPNVVGEAWYFLHAGDGITEVERQSEAVAA